MPIRFIPGKGYRYGKSGKLYRIKTYGKKKARERARKQGQAIELSKLREQRRLIERKGNIIKIKSSRRAKGYTRRL